jgi:hypothetical protein
MPLQGDLLGKKEKQQIEGETFTLSNVLDKHAPAR